MRALLLAAAFASLTGCATLTKEADVRFVRIDLTNSGFARATFAEAEFVEQDRAGNCQLLERSKLHPPDLQDYPEGASPWPNAGPIRITASGEPLVLAPQYHGLYRDGERRLQPLFEAGNTIVVSAPGAAAPGFRIELPAPKPIWSIDPPIQDTNERGPDIWALRDLPLKWQPIDGATVVLQLFQATPDVGTNRSHLREGTRRIRCTFDSKLGSGIVPHSLIAELPVGDAILYVSSMTEQTLDVNGWKIRVRAYTDAIRERRARIDDRPPTGEHGEQ